MNVCVQCKSNFESYDRFYECQYCEDGITESVRDIDFNGTGYCRCHVCQGTTEIIVLEQSFCCEECLDEHEQELFN